MTPNLTRRAIDGATEYLCPTTGRYYRPETVVPSGVDYVWCLCTECDTVGRVLLSGRDPQPHCYPVEANDAPVNR